MADRYWTGSKPKCDFCGKTGERLQTMTDAKTKHGPWAMMCPSCFKKHGIQLGQLYGRQEDGRYKKLQDLHG